MLEISQTITATARDPGDYTHVQPLHCVRHSYDRTLSTWSPRYGFLVSSQGNAFLEHYASRVREPCGFAGYLLGAPCVPGEGAARVHRVPSGSATRPGRGSRAGLPGASLEHHASPVREPRGLTGCLPGAPRVP